MHLPFLMLPQCMILRPLEGNFFPLLFLETFFDITSLSFILVIFPNTMIPHRCFSEEHFSEGNIAFRERYRGDFGTPKISIISE